MSFTCGFVKSLQEKEKIKRNIEKLEKKNIGEEFKIRRIGRKSSKDKVTKYLLEFLRETGLFKFFFPSFFHVGLHHILFSLLLFYVQMS